MSDSGDIQGKAKLNTKTRDTGEAELPHETTEHMEKPEIPKKEVRLPKKSSKKSSKKSLEKINCGKEDNTKVETELVHTALLEKDNPFMEEEPIGLTKSTLIGIPGIRSHKLKNPNEDYEDDSEGLLPLNQGSNIEMCRASLSGSINSINEEASFSVRRNACVK